MYNPHDVDWTLRHFAPGFRRLRSPVAMGDTVSREQFVKHNYEAGKTKAEVVGEYYGVMGRVYSQITKSLLAGAIAAYCIFQVAATGGSLFVAGAMISTAYAMYWWWSSGAAYSNYQEFEMRPLLMPIEDIGTEQAGVTETPKKDV
jgi:hypothetical protein